MSTTASKTDSRTADAVAMQSISDSEPATTATADTSAATADDVNKNGNKTSADTNDHGSAPEPPIKERQDSMAIGPDQVGDGGDDDHKDNAGPICNITLLLTSGSRHPYKISARYLSRRNVPIPEVTDAGLPDPFSISVYTLKELILREWRSDWEAKPASPSSIRLIHFGKLLDDKEALKTYQFLPDSPNVVHMSIRPQDLDEEEPKSGGKATSHGGADGSRRRVGGCCVIL
ncbi:Ubiquitin family [Geosmithia morbida]|uniref:Ubiquitin family n=1 Tax=Geosmithia morbida TaxID=1094350 RepID=A0A9P5D8E3_9HYPO|nr:Ubiquitin family [Geosmithia morbida]KAF4126695.1 Ubiquitin family [Geosmithia morbida]